MTSGGGTPRTIRGRHLLAAELRGRAGYRTVRLLDDPDAHRDLRVHGYHVAPTPIGPDAVAALSEACERWVAASPPAEPGVFHSSYEVEVSEAGLAARRTIREVLLPELAPHLTPTARPRPTVFQYKPPGPASGVQSHQDPHLLDEARSYGLYAWVALTHVRLEDGALVVLPGSHRFGAWHRASTRLDPFLGLHDAIERHARAIELVPGQILWFDNALVHGSLPNRGTVPRLGCSAAVAPADEIVAVPLARDPDARATADLYLLDGAAHLPPGADWRTASHIGTVELDRVGYDAAAIDRVARLHAAIHPDPPGRRLPAGAACTPR